VSVDRITVGCGSVGLLQQLGLAFVEPGDEVVFPWLSFEAYPVYTSMLGGVAVNPPLVDHRFDLGAVADAVTDRTKLILLATPNNPTGTAISTDEVAWLLDRVPERVVVVVDEAYREFADPALGDPAIDLVPHRDNVVVTRTFSKAYGLAGLRVGYAAAHPELVAALDKVLFPFAVNAVAQAGALAALANADAIQPEIDRLLGERARVVAALTDAGWDLPDAQANFVFLPTGDRTELVCLDLERQGVVVRPFPGHGIRVTIGTESENDRFLDALGQIGFSTAAGPGPRS
jgi:histidinol-phosphate aminotransferase